MCLRGRSALAAHHPLRHDAWLVEAMNARNMDGKKRQEIAPGARVLVVEKQNQRSGVTTEGIVQAILTKSQTHPHGIKVRLESGEVGRVKEILDS